MVSASLAGNVFDGSYLAGGMAVEGHTRVDGRHARAVVDDLDQILALLPLDEFQAVVHQPAHGPVGLKPLRIPMTAKS